VAASLGWADKPLAEIKKAIELLPPHFHGKITLQMRDGKPTLLTTEQTHKLD